MLHPATPQDLGRISGEGNPGMKLHDCWAKPAPANRLHFKLMGETTGNDGMLHFGISVPLDQVVSNLAEYCKLPKLLITYLEKEHTPEGKYTARWRGDRSSNKLPGGPLSPDSLPGESSELKYIYHTLARRCKLLIDETNDLYHLLMGPISHNHKIEERWTNSETAEGHDAETYHRRYTSFPGRPLAPSETTPFEASNCTGNNPVGDPFKIKTWERIFVERISYSSKWLPYSLNDKGECTLDGEMWSKIQALHQGLSKKYKDWYGTEEDWEDRKKRARVKVKRGRRRRRASSHSSAWYFANHLSQSAERIKRFVLAMFFAVVAIGSLLFSATQMDSMASRANHNRDETVRLFNKDEHAIRVHDEAIRSMNESIQALNQAVDATFGHIETLQITLKTYAAMDSYFSEHTRILRGLTSLFQHRLSPELIHSKPLADSIKAQQEKFSRMGYRLGLESLDDIFRAPTSWIMYGNATLFVATHVPVYRTSTRFKLLQPDKTMYFAPPPLPPGSDESSTSPDKYAFIVEGEADLLAVSQDGRYYQTLNWAQLNECSKVGALYVCPDSNVLQRTETELSSCLVALYKGNLEHIRKLCRHKSVKRANYALQISSNRFLVRVDTPTLVRFECSGEDQDQRPHIKAEWVNDTALIQVAGMCAATCGDFVLNGRLEFSVQTTAYESQSLEVTDLFPHIVKDDKLWDWERFKAFRDTYDPDGVPFEDVGKRFMKFEDDSFQTWIYTILTWCAIAFIAVLSILALIRWGPKMRDKMRTYSEKRRKDKSPPARQNSLALEDLGASAPGGGVQGALLAAYDRLGGGTGQPPAGSFTGEAYEQQPPYAPPAPTQSIARLDQDIRRQQKKNELAELRLKEQTLERAADINQAAVQQLLDSGGLPKRSKSFGNAGMAAVPPGSTMTSAASEGTLQGATGGQPTGLTYSSISRANRLNTIAFAVSSPSLEALLTDNPSLRLLRFKDDHEGLKHGWPLVTAALKTGRPLYGLCREDVQAALEQLADDSNHGVTQRQAIKMVLDSRLRARKKDTTYVTLTKLYEVIENAHPNVRIDALMFPSRKNLE